METQTSAPLHELARRHPGLYIVVQLDTLIAETKQAGVSFIGSLDTNEKLRERVLSKVDKLYVSPATWLNPGIGNRLMSWLNIQIQKAGLGPDPHQPKALARF